MCRESEVSTRRPCYRAASMSSHAFHRWSSPHPALRPFILGYWSYEGYRPEHALERVVPTGAVELVFGLGPEPLSWVETDGEAATSRAALVQGPRCSAFDVPTVTQHRLLGVRFVPGGAWPLLHVPMDEIAGRHVPLEDVVGGSGEVLTRQTRDTPSIHARWRALDDFFLRRLGSRPNSDVGAVATLQSARTVAEAVERSGMSHRRFIATIRREVGLRPRDYLRVRRLHVALSLLASNRRGGASVAYEAGYTDQSHWILECRKLLGLTPGEVAQGRRHDGRLPAKERGQMVPIA